MTATTFSKANEASCKAIGNFQKAGFSEELRKPMISNPKKSQCLRLSRGRFSLCILAIYIFLFGLLPFLKGSPEPATILLFTCMIVQLTLCVFRLHDFAASGWWLLTSLIVPLPFIVIFLCIKRGDKGQNRFGTDPLEARS